jgi:multiple sugar transport system ATP-binding protein
MTLSLQLHQVEKNFHGVQVLRGISLDIEEGEFVVMVGPSGCGKSTLLRAIAGLDTVSSGRMSIKGRDVTQLEPVDRGIAMVFQSYALYPHMTVAENMGFGLRMARRPQAEIDQAVKRAAEILRITDQLHKKPKQLSGGQRQRVAIGRAITRSPEIFLFDEPLSNLDAALRTQMRVELSTLHAALGATMIYVTHDQVEAMTMATRIVVLNAGLVEQVGTPLALYHQPANRFVAGFLGSPRMNFFAAVVQSVGKAHAVVATPGLPPLSLDVTDASELKPGATVTLGIRPEKLRIVAADSNDATGFPAQVRLVEQLGRETVLYADASPLQTQDSDSGTSNVTVQLSALSRRVPGDAIRLAFDPADAYLFAASGKTLSVAAPDPS